MTELRVEGLSKRYGTREVLRSLDLVVPTGSFTALLGPSGSGKTTLLRVIAGFEAADSGRVRLGGVVVDDGARQLAPGERRIGYVPQEGALFPHLSVEANVGFGLPRHERRGQRVHELLEMIGLEKEHDRYPHELSGGQQQRVALARALAINPALVLLDEPFSALDATLRASIRQDVRSILRTAGATTLLVTHDQDEALSLADSVAVIEAGRIAQHDAPAELYARPASPRLAAAVGQANLIPGVAGAGHALTPLGALELDDWAAPLEAGSPLLALVRPEQISLHEDPGTGASARVIAAEFFGHDALVTVSLDRGEGTDSGLLVRTADAARLPAVGSRVGVTVSGCVVVWPTGFDGDARS